MVLALLAGIASHRNDGSYASAQHDAKVHMQLSFLSTDKENLNNVSTSLTKQIDFVLIGEVQSIRDALTRLIQESSSCRFYISGISASIRSHLWYVEVLRKTYHTAHSEQVILTIKILQACSGVPPSYVTLLSAPKRILS